MPDTLGQNFYDADADLKHLLASALTPEELALAEPHLRELGGLVGGRLDELSRSVDRNPPTLRTTDQRGRVINAVDYHPDYAELTSLAVERFALVAMSHRPVLGFPAPLRHTLKYAFWYLFVQGEFTLACPLSMTDSAIRVLRRSGSPELNASYAERMLRTDALAESGAQFMTEKQGGSDVGANLLSARREGDTWRLYGEKWFCSNVSADIALVLARPEGAPAGTAGLAMFLMPRLLPDGAMNAFRIVRIKDKLGTRAMASGEVAFEGAVAYQVGALGTGFKQMMSMVNSSRLSNAMRSAALMRRSFVEARTSAHGREAFGSPLVEKPLMRETLFRMQLESEAATAMLFNAARIYERADAAVADAAERTGSPSTESVPPDPDSRHIRFLTPLLKGVICKRARTVVAEGMEARGGNGYIDDWVDGKLLRDAQLGSIWEGTTSIVALDVQRAILRNDAARPFLDAIQERLTNSVGDAVLGGVATLLQLRLDAVNAECAGLSEQTSEARESGAIDFMNRLYDLSAAALLLEQAIEQVRSSGNHRKVAVLIGFLRVHVLGDAQTLPERARVLLGGAAAAILDSEMVPEDAVRPAVDALASVLGRAAAAPLARDGARG